MLYVLCYLDSKIQALIAWGKNPDKMSTWPKYAHVLTGLFFSLLVAVISLSFNTSFELFWLSSVGSPAVTREEWLLGDRQRGIDYTESVWKRLELCSRTHA